MNYRKIVFILVNYNGEELTAACINSLCNGTIVPDILLVDNNSNRFNRSHFEKYLNVTIIENSENLGFTGGNNIAIEYALNNSYEYIGLLNNDTVVDRYMVEELMACVKDNVLVAPKMFYYSQPNTIWYAGGYFNKYKGEAYHIGLGENDNGQFDEEREVDFATGCCWLAGRKVFETLGGLSDAFFMYCEDTDFCLRCRRNGIKIIYVPKAKLWHKVGASTGNESVTSVYYRNRNRLYLIKKHKLGITPYYFTCLTRLIKYLLSFVSGNNNYVIKQAYWDFKNGNMGKQEIRSKYSSK